MKIYLFYIFVFANVKLLRAWSFSYPLERTRNRSSSFNENGLYSSGLHSKFTVMNLGILLYVWAHKVRR